MAGCPRHFLRWKWCLWNNGYVQNKKTNSKTLITLLTFFFQPPSNPKPYFSPHHTISPLKSHYLKPFCYFSTQTNPLFSVLSSSHENVAVFMASQHQFFLNLANSSNPCSVSLSLQNAYHFVLPLQVKYLTFHFYTLPETPSQLFQFPWTWKFRCTYFVCFNSSIHREQHLINLKFNPRDNKAW